jgi:hypothetical protein
MYVVFANVACSHKTKATKICFSTFSFSLNGVPVVNSVQDESSGHGKEDPDHAEEGGLEPGDGHDHREQGPHELADLEVERLDDPDAVEELKVLKKQPRVSPTIPIFGKIDHC